MSTPRLEDFIAREIMREKMNDNHPTSGEWAVRAARRAITMAQADLYERHCAALDRMREKTPDDPRYQDAITDALVELHMVGS